MSNANFLFFIFVAVDVINRIIWLNVLLSSWKREIFYRFQRAILPVTQNTKKIIIKERPGVVIDMFSPQKLFSLFLFSGPKSSFVDSSLHVYVCRIFSAINHPRKWLQYWALETINLWLMICSRSCDTFALKVPPWFMQRVTRENHRFFISDSDSFSIKNDILACLGEGGVEQFY